VLTLAGCSKAISGQPQASKLPQGVLSPHFTPEPDPLRAFKEGLFEPLVQPGPDQVRIPGYRLRIAADGKTSTVSIQDYNPYERKWEPLSSPEVVWSPAQGKWVTTDRTETLSAGPNGSRDRPTVKSVADYGTSYYTVSSDDLAGRPLADGLSEGFAQGLQLPDSTREVKFSPGARSYELTTTVIGPIFLVVQIANAITKVPQYFHVYSCAAPSPNCDTVATSLDQVAKQGGRVQNFPGNAELEFDSNGNATLSPVGMDVAFANLTYRVVNDDDPHRITLQAAHPDDEKKFAQAFGMELKTFALYEYNDEVTIGNARPSYNTTTEFAGYNRIAINDLLTHWTPQMPEVLP
jgi:hypothetical protein